jgi:hypothetical protein
MKFVLTDYVPRRSHPKHWIPLVFLCQVDDRDYCFGFEWQRPVSCESMVRRAEAGGILPISPPVPMDLGQILWLIPGGGLCVANKENPVGDPHKVLVGTQPPMKEEIC